MMSWNLQCIIKRRSLRHSVMKNKTTEETKTMDPNKSKNAAEGQNATTVEEQPQCSAFQKARAVFEGGHLQKNPPKTALFTTKHLETTRQNEASENDQDVRYNLLKKSLFDSSEGFSMPSHDQNATVQPVLFEKSSSVMEPTDPSEFNQMKPEMTSLQIAALIKDIFSKLNQNQQEMQQFRSQQNAMKQELSEIKQILKGSNLNLQNEDLKKENQDLKQNYEVLENKFKVLMDDKDNISQQNEDLKQENQDLKQNYEVLEEKFKVLVAEKDDLSLQNEDLKRENHRLEQRYKTFQDEVKVLVVQQKEDMKQLIDNLQEKHIKAIDEKFKVVMAENEDLRLQKDDLTRKIQDLTQNSKALDDSFQAMTEQEQNEVLKQKLDEFRQKSAKLQHVVTDRLNSVKRTEDVLIQHKDHHNHNLGNETEVINQQSDLLKQEIHDCKENLEAVNDKIKVFKEKKEDLSLKQDHEEKVKVLMEEIEEMREKIIKLKREIRSRKKIWKLLVSNEEIKLSRNDRETRITAEVTEPNQRDSRLQHKGQEQDYEEKLKVLMEDKEEMSQEIIDLERDIHSLKKIWKMLVSDEEIKFCRNDREPLPTTPVENTKPYHSGSTRQRWWRRWFH